MGDLEELYSTTLFDSSLLLGRKLSSYSIEIRMVGQVPGARMYQIRQRGK